LGVLKVSIFTAPFSSAYDAKTVPLLALIAVSDLARNGVTAPKSFLSPPRYGAGGRTCIARVKPDSP